jgi:pantoate--beta-alanine ligase
MHVSHTLQEWQERRRAIEGRTIGFVPTMGALHRGHASLVERSVHENDVTCVSIFVNPTQFNDPCDLERYPRTLENDLALLESLGTTEVLAPVVEEMYPHGRRFRVEESGDSSVMEGAFRPGFFTGVLTVVLKLLNLVRANRAYFGEKDYQQLRLISDMAREFFVPTEIVACETVRAASGLAESSRNELLSESARDRSSAIFRALTSAADSEAARAMLETQGFAVDYVEERWGRRFAAASIDGVRLIDNVPVS